MSREGKALFWYVAREDYALFDMSREKITRFFDVSREMDPRASSGKFLRVKSRYPESFMFLGLCRDISPISNFATFLQKSEFWSTG